MNIRKTCFVIWMIVLAIGLWSSAAEAQPERERIDDVGEKSNIPKGFELQPLELGGQIIRPVGWKYESREVGKTLASKMWKPLPNDETAFDTAVTIDIITNTAEAGQRPSEYAASYLKSLAKMGKVIKTPEPTTTKGVIQSGLLIDQKLKITDTEKEYRIRYILIADDELKLLFVMTFGTLVDQWDTYEPTFREMTKHLKLFDLSDKGKSK